MAYILDDNGEIKIAACPTPADLRLFFNAEKPYFDSLKITWNAVDKYVVLYR